jgi:hypothetical protein
MRRLSRSIAFGQPDEATDRPDLALLSLDDQSRLRSLPDRSSGCIRRAQVHDQTACAEGATMLVCYLLFDREGSF